MTDAYIETTVLTDLLLKQNSKKQQRAKAALRRYKSTLLPVYSIKEMKAGPLKTFAHIHDKLVLTQSLADTLQAISETPFRTYRRGTSDEAIAASAQIAKSRPFAPTALGSTDRDQAASFSYSLASLIIRSWRKRRRITTKVVDDLPCYMESAPRIRKDGLFDVSPVRCEEDAECCLASKLKSAPEKLQALRNAIPSGSNRTEDQKRRQALKKIINHPGEIVTRDVCDALGDAIFAFFCPENAVVLTTNLRDHVPLTGALGKTAENP